MEARNSNKKLNLNNQSMVRWERKAISNIRDFKFNNNKDRKKSMNPKPLNRGNTTSNKSSPHFISITGNDRNKLEFPVKINRK